MTALMDSRQFRFDAVEHIYSDDAGRIPNITTMLEETGWIDSTWFTEESSIRGTCVHELTAHYDLGALDARSCASPYKNYLLAHVKAMQSIPHEWWEVEEPRVHPTIRFGGRPDRVGIMYNLRAVCDGKSGDRPSPARPIGSLALPTATSHEIQTALQAILVAPLFKIEPEAIARFCLYWKKSGKFVLEQHESKQDLMEARRILRVCGC